MTKYLTIDQLRAKLGNRGRSTLYRDVSEGRLPQPVKLGHRTYFSETEVDAALANAERAEITTRK